MTMDEVHADARWRFKVRVFTGGELVHTVVDTQSAITTNLQVWYVGNDDFGMAWVMNLYVRRPNEIIVDPVSGKEFFRVYLSSRFEYNDRIVMSIYPRPHNIAHRIGDNDYEIVADMASEVTVAGQKHLVTLEQSPIVITPTDEIPAGAAYHNPTFLETSARAAKFRNRQSFSDLDITQGFIDIYNRLSMTDKSLSNFIGGLDIYARPSYGEIVRHPDSGKLLRGRYLILNDNY